MGTLYVASCIEHSRAQERPPGFTRTTDNPEHIPGTSRHQSELGDKSQQRACLEALRTAATGITRYPRPLSTLTPELRPPCRREDRPPFRPARETRKQSASGKSKITCRSFHHARPSINGTDRRGTELDNPTSRFVARGGYPLVTL